MRYSREQLTQGYEKLPEEIKRLLGSSEITDKIINIGKKYNLHLDEQSNLNEEMSLVLYGLEKTENFNSNLRRNINLSEDLANLITYDLNQQIFSKIREELKNSSSPKQIFEEKMGGISNVPKQEVEVKTQTEDNKVAGAETKPPRDPYREQII